MPYNFNNKFENLKTSESSKIKTIIKYFKKVDEGDLSYLDLFTDDVQFFFPKFGTSVGVDSIAFFFDRMGK